MMSEPYYDSGNPYEPPPPDPEPVLPGQGSAAGVALGVLSIVFAIISFFLFLDALGHPHSLPATAVFSVLGLYVGFKAYRLGEYLALAAVLVATPPLLYVLAQICIHSS